MTARETFAIARVAAAGLGAAFGLVLAWTVILGTIGAAIGIVAGGCTVAFRAVLAVCGALV